MMRFLAMLVVCLSQVAFAGPRPATPEVKNNLTVLVDENLVVPMTHISRAYAKLHHTPLTIAILNPGETENEIVQGLEAHVLLTANQGLRLRLAAQGLTDVSGNRTIARAPLVLVASPMLGREQALVKHISFAATLFATPDIPVLTNAPESEEGKQVHAMMQGYEFSEQLQNRVENKASREALSEALHTHKALGLLLAPDALRDPELSILSILPDSLSAPARYDAVVLASESMAEARGLAQFLTSPPAQKILAQFGFQPPEK